MKILIVDDDTLVREGLKLIFEIEDDFEVVGLAANGQEAYELCNKLQPDIILMDVRMPVMDGVLGTKLIKSSYKNIKIVILTTFRDDEYIKEAIKSGAEGYILKNQPADTMIESLRTVAKGNYVFEKEVANSISSMLKNHNKIDISQLKISTRELQILQLVVEGLSNKEIAEKLFISDGTVRNYVTGLLEKLNFRDRTQLAIFYVKNF
ncbi:two component transcriptional regulator, LuxR family [Clostridium pasteurianum DSM 525 = ATCC 6013]|uniref:Stage 0 sporulation protein A homolog n=1 Tax=Clostridium pasteurianum DSM 525 = ATCC 6013 TaxID=1262449 RepID=A0A0H3J6C4_CLOPA|nr:response regulator transcription factor [Clostridium pasteurianum]AJA46495.1 two component transcriptional regulator, LuxR family [Clostridium pasteurianum DSM 525 = ATCC 6013]AJA50483.1 two component transcriptional regulator, LuxR family [Clostridium pasteurianum DSM 525 = ATCC 6013]AOZ73922.1 LuxR family transcriptional regulator [Clostridium pasteurianum DSM 525 = ATCC 6013]AOZ77719.1 LuxR family transcriptional regulator [Clostridium pasteurianum]ELP61068.1 LuxR family transcriptional 